MNSLTATIPLLLKRTPRHEPRPNGRFDFPDARLWAVAFPITAR